MVVTTSLTGHVPGAHGAFAMAHHPHTQHHAHTSHVRGGIPALPRLGGDGLSFNLVGSRAQQHSHVEWPGVHGPGTPHKQEAHDKPAPRLSIVLPELISAGSSIAKPSREGFNAHRRGPFVGRETTGRRLPVLATHPPRVAAASAAPAEHTDAALAHTIPPRRQSSHAPADVRRASNTQKALSVEAMAHVIEEEDEEGEGDSGVGSSPLGADAAAAPRRAVTFDASAPGCDADDDSRRARRTSIVTLTLETVADVRNRKLEDLKRRGFTKPSFVKVDGAALPSPPVAGSAMIARTRRSIVYAAGFAAGRASIDDRGGYDPAHPYTHQHPHTHPHDHHDYDADAAGAAPPRRVSVFHRMSNARASIFEFQPRSFRNSIFEYPIGEIPLPKKAKAGRKAPNVVTEARIKKMKLMEADKRQKKKESDELAAEMEAKAAAENSELESSAHMRQRMRGCIEHARTNNIISEQQSYRFTLLFRALDTGGKGVLTMEELKQGLEHVTVEEGGQIEYLSKATRTKVAYIMKVLDLDGNNAIDEDEFVVSMALCERINEMEGKSSKEGGPLNGEFDFARLEREIKHYRQLFLLCDADGSGFLSVDELQVLLASSGQVASLSEVQAILTQMDKDNNGVVDFVEFLAFIPFFVEIHERLVGNV